MLDNVKLNISVKSIDVSEEIVVVFQHTRANKFLT